MDIDSKIRQIVPGRSFVDVGGLWGAENERVSIASAAGARSVTMADMLHPDDVWWAKFKVRMTNRGIRDYKSIVANLDNADFAEKVPVTDVVHCSGILYHAPNPLWTLTKLRAITGSTLLLCSMTVPEIIAPGKKRLFGGKSIDMRKTGPIFVPLVDEEKRAILAAYFDSVQITVHNINSPQPYPWRTNGEFNYEPWWWLWTPQLLSGIIELAGFKVTEVFDGWKGYSHYFVCERR